MMSITLDHSLLFLRNPLSEWDGSLVHSPLHKCIHIHNLAIFFFFSFEFFLKLFTLLMVDVNQGYVHFIELIPRNSETRYF